MGAILDLNNANYTSLAVLLHSSLLFRLGQVWYLTVLNPDICLLPYFYAN